MAHAINSGDNTPPPVISEVAKVQAWSDLNFIAASSPEDCLAKITELCTKFIPQHFKWFHPVNDVQVLAPMHKGVAGVGNLNAALQAALNGNRPGIKTVSGEFRPGDKLIQLRNNYDKDLFNGDIGSVVAIDGVPSPTPSASTNPRAASIPWSSCPSSRLTLSCCSAT